MSLHPLLGPFFSEDAAGEPLTVEILSFLPCDSASSLS